MPFIEFQILDIKYWERIEIGKKSSDILEFDRFLFDETFDMIKNHKFNVEKKVGKKSN